MGNCVVSRERVHTFGFSIKVDVMEKGMRGGTDWVCCPI